MTTLTKAGRYELLEELGRGAMGVVYKAFDPVIGRSVAVKTMRLSEAGTSMSHVELLSRFQTEARAAGLLAHPNIVVVYDAGEEDGVFYITMEYVEGRSLQSLLDARQTFPLARTLRLMEQVCSALEYAHQRNVVHRDIKPANLMLTPDDTLKITDFGTAKILQFGTAHTQHVIGTPSYMSPEQVKGKPVDGRSDIFALGVILYELVTGEKPFPGENITTVIYKIVNEEPIPPRELDSTVHPGLNAVITRALAKNPTSRFQTCRQLLEALRNYRTIGGSPEATFVAPVAGVPDVSAAPESVPRVLPRMFTGMTTIFAEPPKKRHSIWLTLLLLAIIGGAGYRVWPHMMDIWHRSQDAKAVPAPAVTDPKPAPLEASPATAPPANSRPAPAESAAPKEKPKPVEARPSEPKVGSGTSESPAAPPLAAANPSQPDAAAAPAKAEPAEIAKRVQERLAQSGLGRKVRVEGSGNTYTLRGRLAPGEHRQLLRLLRNAPSWMHFVDDIEYSAPGAPTTKEAPAGDAAANDDRPRTVPGRGEIEVLTDKLGATAALRGPQGKPLGECTTPCRFEDLFPGRYTLEVNQAGFRPVIRVLPVRAGGIVSERIELQAMAAGLFVTSKPPQAQIFVNGELQPEATPATIKLGPGSYSISVRKNGFEPYAGQVQLKENEFTQVSVELIPARKP